MILEFYREIKSDSYDPLPPQKSGWERNRDIPKIKYCPDKFVPSPWTINRVKLVAVLLKL
jgi:hypothetical protein